jgi:hypothetical protein
MAELSNLVVAVASPPRSAFKEVSRCLFESVQHRFPDSRYKVVGSFFFLRYSPPPVFPLVVVGVSADRSMHHLL